ncbi:MAG: glycosyltransferase family 2 protein [Psychroserpens sp.]|nr:glycosyltransferase family 2 protein [Psychroserpens sp.]
MKLSIVIPTYNAERFIRKAYQNILDQNVKEFEIIFVDNNSTDNSVGEIKKLSEVDDRVFCYSAKKQGAASARNKGFEMSTGSYLYFFDVDDEIFPSALNKMIKVFEERPTIDVVFGKFIKSSQRLSQITIPTDQTDEVIIKEKPYWGLRWLKSLKNVVGPAGFMYRRSVFEDIGPYNTDLSINEDTALDIKMGMLCNVAFLDTYVYLYFRHETSTIDHFKKRKTRAELQWPRFVKEHLPFYLEHRSEKEFGRMIRRQMYLLLGRQIFDTKGLSNRRKLKQQLVSDIEALDLPGILRGYLNILVLFPFSYIHKFYGYYLVPYVIKNS